MTQQQTGHTIADIYRSVINDVISQVKEAFLDENVDIDVLQQLKKEWEDKLAASGSVDMDGTRALPPPAIRQIKQPHIIASNSTIPTGSSVRIAQNGQHILVQQSAPPGSGSQSSMAIQNNAGQPIQRPIQQVQYISANSLPITTDPNSIQQVVQRQQLGQGPSQTISAIPSGMIAFQPGQNARIVHQGGQQFFMHTGGPTNIPPGSSVMILNANGQQIPVTLGNATVLQASRVPPQQINPKVESSLQQHSLEGSTVLQTTNRVTVPPNQVNPKIETRIHQLDGGGFISASDNDGRSQSTFCLMKNETTADVAGSSQVQQLLPRSQKPKNMKTVPQLDGGGRMSDSSSDDDDVDEDEDDDPLRRIVDRIGDDGNNIGDDEEQVAEEDPLNSGDDQSDDEDLETLFEAENVVMCQFEKVHRARSKWKFTLKDGIMHIQGKDYCFQRCSGEAEW
ncbi:hypothetical protein AB6A40_000274 [Gnathostoma spinigerum]|uniref:Uncharacterized protein n=1 Tax=Gnathostoma spinigerum TaxID=75299 RepID=A0ABD6E1T5_9BILA